MATINRGFNCVVVPVATSNGLVVGITTAKEWFKIEADFTHISPDDFVVGTWVEHKMKNYISDKTTVAVCRYRKDAEILFHSRINHI